MANRFRCAPAWAILLALAAPQAWAEDDPETLTFSATQALRYDSNLFRRNSNERSETLSTSTVGMEFDKRYSLQRIELDANVASHSYRSNEYLDFNALNYRAVWHWSLTPRLHGTLSRTRSEEINTFDYYRSFDRNVRTEHATAAQAQAELGSDWRLLGGIERDRRDNERPTAQQGDYTLRNVSAGLRRLFPSGSSISYRMLDGRGDYSNRIPGVSLAPTAFEQREHELRLSWSASGKTTLNARLAYLQRKHPGFEVRDFSGPRGDVSLQWRATAKVGVQLTLARDLGTYQTNTSSYSTNNRVSMYPYWSIGPRTIVYGSYDHIRYRFGGTLPGVAEEDREDRTNGASLGIRWNPIDALSLSASLAHERRTSSLEGFNYSNSVARVAAKFAF